MGRGPVLPSYLFYVIDSMSLPYIAILFVYAWYFLSLGLAVSSKHRHSTRLRLKMTCDNSRNFDALLLDCDGVIAETERDVHRVSFNRAFKEKGLANVWDEDLYGELLKIGGGKERLAHYFDTQGWPGTVANADRTDFVADLHKLKTVSFQSIVQGGGVKLRPGVMRLVDEALVNDMRVAVCSTSNEIAVRTVVRELLGERLQKMKIFAGDIVEKKKPAPDVYLKASETLGVPPERCWVVEDSGIGLAAAKAAGMRCVVTKSIYTRGEDFSIANQVVDNLDDGPDGPISIGWLNYKAKDRAAAPVGNSNADLFGAEPDFAGMFSQIVDGKGSPFGM